MTTIKHDALENHVDKTIAELIEAIEQEMGVTEEAARQYVLSRIKPELNQ